MGFINQLTYNYGAGPTLYDMLVSSCHAANLLSVAISLLLLLKYKRA